MYLSRCQTFVDRLNSVADDESTGDFIFECKIVEGGRGHYPFVVVSANKGNYYRGLQYNPTTNVITDVKEDGMVTGKQRNGSLYSPHLPLTMALWYVLNLCRPVGSRVKALAEVKRENPYLQD